MMVLLLIWSPAQQVEDQNLVVTSILNLAQSFGLPLPKKLAMLLLGTTVDGFFVWNFKFGSLGFI